MVRDRGKGRSFYLSRIVPLYLFLLSIERGKKGGKRGGRRRRGHLSIVFVKPFPVRDGVPSFRFERFAYEGEGRGGGGEEGKAPPGSSPCAFILSPRTVLSLASRPSSSIIGVTGERGERKKKVGSHPSSESMRGQVY